MKFEIRTPDGRSKTTESDDKKHIEVLLKRGWKEVKSAPKKKASKKKSGK